MAMIQVESTPNPHSLKFTATEGRFSKDEIVAISSKEEADRHVLGERLLRMKGVDDVFITPEFVTVSKAPSTEWASLKNDVETVLSEYLLNE